MLFHGNSRFSAMTISKWGVKSTTTPHTVFHGWNTFTHSKMNFPYEYRHLFFSLFAIASHLSRMMNVGTRLDFCVTPARFVFSSVDVKFQRNIIFFHLRNRYVVISDLMEIEYFVCVCVCVLVSTLYRSLRWINFLSYSCHYHHRMIELLYHSELIH